MKCFVYRSSKKDGLYVYLSDPEAITTLPEPVMNQLGTPEPALTFELTPDRKLGSEDANEVLSNLETQGFHLQMPRDIEDAVAGIADQAVDSAKRGKSD